MRGSKSDTAAVTTASAVIGEPHVPKLPVRLSAMTDNPRPRLPLDRLDKGSRHETIIYAEEWSDLRPSRLLVVLAFALTEVCPSQAGHDASLDIISLHDRDMIRPVVPKLGSRGGTRER
jgi:hypothetical protein